MITLSLDPHPGSHTVVALDPNGATLGQHHCSQYAGRSFPIAPVCRSVCSSSLGDRRSGQSFHSCFREPTVGAERDQFTRFRLA